MALSNNEEIASRVTAHILGAAQQMAAFPAPGRQGRVAGTRELVISNLPFIVAYAIEETRIVILAIYHGAQRWPEVF
jgi:plasmid stabilization system protein ParE